MAAKGDESMSRLGLVFAISAVAAIAPLGAQSDNHNGQVPVLLELFTSEGVRTARLPTGCWKLSIELNRLLEPKSLYSASMWTTGTAWAGRTRFHPRSLLSDRPIIRERCTSRTSTRRR